jgi:hypothetical protein
MEIRKRKRSSRALIVFLSKHVHFPWNGVVLPFTLHTLKVYFYTNWTCLFRRDCFLCQWNSSPTTFAISHGHWLAAFFCETCTMSCKERIVLFGFGVKNGVLYRHIMFVGEASKRFRPSDHDGQSRPSSLAPLSCMSPGLVPIGHMVSERRISRAQNGRILGNNPVCF